MKRGKWIERSQSQLDGFNGSRGDGNSTVWKSARILGRFDILNFYPTSPEAFGATNYGAGIDPVFLQMSYECGTTLDASIRLVITVA